MDWPIPPPETERQAGNSQSWKRKGNLSPRDGILHQTERVLSVADKVFLRSWTVDICQGGHSLRSAPQGTRGTPRKLSSWEQGGD